SVKSGARGRMEHLVCLLAGRCGLDEAERPFFTTRGMCQGLRPRELFAVAAHARRALGEFAVELASAGRARLESQVTKGFNVLARAMRSDRPGVVFAQAAAIGETDPLTDLDSRLFVGLPPR
ncbi:MAG: hypothetical protein AMJ81_13160, partial [Phycisphaerae bacterium SM23_33]